MPLYDFHCPRCDATFELLMRSTDVATCPACGGQELAKLVSLPATPGKSTGIIQRTRRQAAREGHFSHYAPAERPKIK